MDIFRPATLSTNPRNFGFVAAIIQPSDAAWPCKTANGQYNSLDLSRAKLARLLN
jgi:hypothetical protein